MSDYEPKCKKTLPIIFDDRMPTSNLTPKLVNRVNNNTEDLKDLYGETETVQGDIESLREDVDDKLDIPETAGTAGQVLTSDGEGGAVWASVGSGEIVVDPTLTIEGAAADAKKTGDEITHLKQDNSKLETRLSDKQPWLNVTYTPQNSQLVVSGKIATISNGEVVYTSASAYSVYRVDVPDDTFWIRMNKTMSSGTYAIYVDGQGSPSYLIGFDNKRIHRTGGYVLYNYSTTNGYDGVTIQRYDLAFPNVYSSALFNATGIMQNGSITASQDYLNYKITDLRYAYYEDTFSPAKGSCFDTNDSYLGELTVGKDESGYNVFNYPNGTAYFIVNQSINDSKYDLKRTNRYGTDTIIGHTCNRYDFSGKTITLMGDSIAYGYASDTQSRTEDRWINLFTANNNCTCNNIASSGARFARITSNSILTQMESSLNTDFIFIAAGTNDYGESTPIGTPTSTSDQDLYGALNILCAYLTTNYPNAKVIFILPINRPGHVSNTIPLVTYRDVIREVAIKNSYEVVDGSLFGFPKHYGTYSTVVIPDGVHPTVAGYKMYAKAFENAVAR